MRGLSDWSGRPGVQRPRESDEPESPGDPSSALVLEALAASAGDNDGCGVTLSVAGGVVTGKLVSARGWFRGVQAELLAAGPDHQTTVTSISSTPGG